MSDTIQITRGSSASIGFTWLKQRTVAPALPDPIDLTPYNVEVYEPHPSLAGHLTASITDATAGKSPALLTWVDDMPLGRVMHLNLRLVPKPAFPALLPIASPRIWIEVIE